MSSGKPEVSAQLDQGPRGAGFPANHGRMLGSDEEGSSSLLGAGVLYLITKTFWDQGVDCAQESERVTVSG